MPDEVDSKSPSPSWEELKSFIDKQSEKDRALIDFWFKLAAGILGFLVLAASGAAVFVGWKTLGDAKSTAEQAARDAATAQVKLLMQTPEIQKIANDTAAQLFQNGAYRAEVERSVHDQMQKAIEGAIVGRYVVSINGTPNQSLRIDRRATGPKQ